MSQSQLDIVDPFLALNNRSILTDIRRGFAWARPAGAVDRDDEADNDSLSGSVATASDAPSSQLDNPEHESDKNLSAGPNSESNSYSWLSPLLCLFSLHLGAPGRSFRVVPQGKIVGSLDAPDFNAVLESDEFVDIPLGYFEVKLENQNGETLRTFSATFIQTFPQMLRYTMRLFDGSSDVKRARSMFSCGERFALLEWYRPGVLETDEQSNIVNWPPGVPQWVQESESSYYSLLNEQLADLKKSSGYDDLRLLAPGALNDQLRVQLDVCTEALHRLEGYTPVIIMFGERIFRPLGGQNRLSAAFCRALRLFFTPLDEDIAEPSWDIFAGSIFEDDPSFVVEQDPGLNAGKLARRDARTQLFRTASHGLESLNSDNDTASHATSSATPSYDPASSSGHDSIDIPPTRRGNLRYKDVQVTDELVRNLAANNDLGSLYRDQLLDFNLSKGLGGRRDDKKGVFIRYVQKWVDSEPA